MSTKIEWARNEDGTRGETWNPVTGCTKISPACDRCYAQRMSKRLAGRAGYPEAPHNFDVSLHPDRLAQPLRWKKPRRIFVCSMGDLFHDDVPDEYIAAIFGVMSMAKHHTFIVLTKRPFRARKLLTRDDWPELMIEALSMVGNDAAQIIAFLGQGRRVTRRGPLPWVWIGVTAEDQQRWDERVGILRRIPAAVRFVSVEPALGHIVATLDGISWLVVGGETGPGSRPMHPDWARGLRDQCVDAGVSYFFKSWGDWAPKTRYGYPPNEEHSGEIVWWETISSTDRKSVGKKHPVAYGRDGEPIPMERVGKKAAGRELDGRTWDEMPEVER